MKNEKKKDIDNIIHSPSRLVIMHYLFHTNVVDFTYLQLHTGLSWGNISVHISILEEKGYVNVKKEILNKKSHSVVTLTKKGRSAFDVYKKEMKSFLEL